MSAEPTAASKSEQRRQRFIALWKANHGNFLLAFVIVVALLNVAAVIYQQARFVPIKFPDERAFRAPQDRSDPSFSVDPLVTIRVVGAPTMEGSIVVAVFDKPENFEDLDSAALVRFVPIENGVAICRFAPEELPQSLAILAFHDENEDQAITLNHYGVSIERYGYSGDQRFVGPAEPPSFESSLIERPNDGGPIDIFIR